MGILATAYAEGGYYTMLTSTLWAGDGDDGVHACMHVKPV